MRLTPPPPAPDTIHEQLNTLLQTHGLRLNRRQRERLAWIAERTGLPAIWRPDQPVPRACKSLIVAQTPKGTQVETLRRSLPVDAVLVIPHGEDPAFDWLKSRLVGYGTVGADGPDGPHQMWWGGSGWQAFTPSCVADGLPIIASCYMPGTPAEHDARALLRSVETIGATHIVRPWGPSSAPELLLPRKADFILSVWRETARPLLWLDPATTLVAPPSLPGATGCDFAIHRKSDWRFAGHTLFFGRSTAAEALLETWQRLCMGFPTLCEDDLLDQAWCLVTSQMSLDSVWLPRTYNVTRNEVRHNEYPILVRHEDGAGAGAHAGLVELAAEPALHARVRSARRSGRTGAPELVVSARPSARGGAPIMAVVRHAHPIHGRTFAAVIEAMADAFANDAGGFSQLEIMLSPTETDMRWNLGACGHDRALIVTSQEDLPPDMFRQFRSIVDQNKDVNRIHESDRTNAVVEINSVRAARPILH